MTRQAERRPSPRNRARDGHRNRLRIAELGEGGGELSRTNNVESLPVAPAEWRGYLTEFSDAFFRNVTGSGLWGLDDEQMAARWLGYAPASERLVAEAEERLGVRLPPSLLGFLLTTDGWSRPADWVERVCPCHDIQWFAETLVGTSFIGEASRDLRDAPSSQQFLEMLKRMLVVADGDDVWLLDTGKANADGEYVAWHLTVKYGIFQGRYPTFSALFANGRAEIEESAGGAEARG